MTPLFGIDHPGLRVAFWVGLLSAAASALLMIGVYFFRRHHTAAKRREKTFTERWLDIFHRSPLPETLPSLDASQVYPFLRLWAHTFEEAAGTDPALRERLRHLAQRLDLGSAALSLLHKPTHRSRIAATLILGHLQEERARFSLNRFARSGDAHLAPTAMLSLVRMGPDRALPLLTEVLCTDFQWNGQATARVLEELDETRLQSILKRAVQEYTTEEVLCLFRNLQRAEHSAAWELADRIGNRAQWDQRLAARLHQSESLTLSAQHQVAIENYLAENVQRLRLLKALTNPSRAEQNAELQPLLESSSPWIRERANQFLSNRPATLLRGTNPTESD